MPSDSTSLSLLTENLARFIEGSSGRHLPLCLWCALNTFESEYLVAKVFTTERTSPKEASRRTTCLAVPAVENQYMRQTWRRSVRITKGFFQPTALA